MEESGEMREAPFKMPIPISKVPKKEKDKKGAEVAEDQGNEGKDSRDCPTVVNRNTSLTPSKDRTDKTPIPYEEPSWGGIADCDYFLEEMKGGVSLRTIPLNNRSFYCFGRLANCHIIMAHPTTSRYHAVLQFRPTLTVTDEKRGFYIYDMESSHGTFLNKHRIKPNVYVKVQVGHILKFGGSTRFFLLHGPEQDQEQESRLSFTELKELRRKQLEERDSAAKEGEQTEGINWGMGEDADAETDVMENPFAATPNEELYLDDPKKTLRGWFEREGEEMSYNVIEHAFGQFKCTIDLPIENAPNGVVTAEAIVSGKKKEAVHQCALEACRILDRHGILRQATHESKKKKSKNWEADDYYDSDEDNFFDRTGELENKRRRRMMMAADTSKQYLPSLKDLEIIKKRDEVTAEIHALEVKLAKVKGRYDKKGENNEGRDESGGDSLDSFMSHLDDEKPVDKIEWRRMKNELEGLKRLAARYQSMVDKSGYPVGIPKIVYAREEAAAAVPMECEDDKGTMFQNNDKKKDKVNLAFAKPKVVDARVVKGAFPDEEEEDDDGKKGRRMTLTKLDYDDDDKEQNMDMDMDMEKRVVKSAKESVQRLGSNAALLKSLATKKPEKKNLELSEKQMNEDFNNVYWTPPSGQSGDGKTSLNEKLGY